MKLSKFSALMALLLLAMNSLTAQRFLEPSETFSPKKVSYLTMMDGSVKEVFLKSIKREKGLIEELKVEDAAGTKSKIKPKDIKFMYLPQSGFDKFSKEMDFIHDVQKWDNKEIDQSKVADGYIYFEQAEVQVKKEKLTLMMQLLNPSFSSKIKVYHDPYAAESASVGIGGFTLAGGDDKSYYVAVRNQTAFKLMKKNYEEDFMKVFGFCSPLKNKFEKINWSQFDEHVYEHNQNCE